MLARGGAPGLPTLLRFLPTLLGNSWVWLGGWAVTATRS